MYDEFDDDDELARIREARLKELKEQSKAKQQLLTSNGEYAEIEESEFLKKVTSTENVVVHFYHKEFQRCKIIDKHFEMLSKFHLSTSFLKIDAERAMFFIEKLKIRVLPTIVCFHNGIVADRIVGFDEFGGKDDFKVEVLAKRLHQAGVLNLKSTAGLTVISKSDRLKQQNIDD
eukprot:gene5231-6512_t